MISNQSYAKIFEEFAELLELKEEIPFKIIAYQKASRSIGDLSESIEDIYRRKGLKGLLQVEGIGESIAEKIEEYIKTGKIKELSKLKQQFPQSEIEYLKIPGVGPATAKILFQNFGSGSIRDLSTKLSREGSKFFKPKSLKKILKGIENYKNLGERMLLDEAIELSRPILKFLREECGAHKVEAVGSLRRRKETVGDIDIVATSEHPQKTIDKFALYPDFLEIVSKGPVKLSAILRNSREVDLEILRKDEYGSLLLHFTGSKQHNVSLRSLAQKRGLSISEHGIKNEKTGKTILCSEEKDVYDALGLDFIVPELREDRGEVQAAFDKKLPDLVKLEDIKGDLHLHSNWSDGSASIEDLARKALELNYEYIAISDHTVSLGIARGLDKKKFLSRRKEIEKVQAKYKKIKIFDSCEVNILADGSLDLSDDLIKTFDIVTASVHSSFNQNKQDMTRRIIRAIEHPFVNVIGHLTGRMLNKRPGYEADWEAIFASAKKENVLIEINSFPIRLDLPDYLISEAKSKVRFIINTDSHSLGQLDNMKYGVWNARRGWLEKNDIINTMDLLACKKWLNR